MQPDLFHCKVTYMFPVSQHPSSGVLKTVTAASGTSHNIGTATSFQRSQIWPRWKEVAVAVPILWPIPEAAVTVLVLLMMGAVTPETCRVTLQWNKSGCILLHLVGLLFNMNYDARNHELKKKYLDIIICIMHASFTDFYLPLFCPLLEVGRTGVDVSKSKEFSPLYFLNPE